MKYKCIYLLNAKELMHRDTNNRVAQWTSMETKSETRGPWEVNIPWLASRTHNEYAYSEQVSTKHAETRSL